MSDDRYAPPSAALGDPARERGTGRIDLGEAFREAWTATWAHFGLLLGAWLLLVVLSALSVLTVLGTFLILPVLFWGVTRFVLNAIDGSAEIGDLFAGFSDYARVLGAMLVLMMLVLLIYFTGQGLAILGRASGSGLLTFAGVILNLVWGLGVIPRLAFVAYYVVDQGLAPVEAVKTSWSVTSDQKLTCLLLALLCGVIPFIGLLCLVVGVIPATMLVYLLQAAAYRQLAGR
jgi:hypothetical protein